MMELVLKDNSYLYVALVKRIKKKLRIDRYKSIFPILIAILWIMLLPPVWGMIISLYLFVNKRKEYIYAFIATFSVFCTYYFFSVDNGLRYIYTYQKASMWEWYEGDPLTSLIYLGTKWLKLECSHFFYLYNFLIYFIWYYLLKKIVHKSISIQAFCVIFLTSISLQSTVGLVYYTLSLLWGTYFFSSKELFTRLSTPFYYIILIVSVYLLHPGFLLILLPAIGLYYTFKISDNIYFISLVFLFVISSMIGHIKITYTGIGPIDQVLIAYDSYTGLDNEWGIRKGFAEIKGLTYSIIYYIIPSFYGFIFYLSIKYRYYLKKFQVVAIFQTAAIFYVNMLSFVTITGRTLVVLSVTAMLTALQLYRIKRCILKLSYIVSFSFIFFIFSLTKESAFCFPDKTLRNYSDIRTQIYYIPSFILLDYNNWGYSDDFLKYNLHIR